MAVLFQFLRQPPILAYILAGIIIGPFGQVQFHDQEIIKSFGDFGITLLLFTLGLELSFRELRSIGKKTFIIGLSQMIITWILGYGTAVLLGFNHIISLYIGVALTFSSTIIIVKLLSDKKDLTSLYGKLSIGLLLMQDFAAIFVLMLLSSIGSSSFIGLESFLMVFLKGIIILGIVIAFSKIILPLILKRIAKSRETLFLFSLAFVFSISFIISSPPINFPIEIGGFLAGVALANSNENFQIIAMASSLRDFFITIFFVVLGMGLFINHFIALLIPALVLSFFVLLVKPLIAMVVMGLIGYGRRTSFLVGLNISQISEFSLIIVFLAYSLKLIDETTVSLLTLVGVITFTVSAYLILYGNALYNLLNPILGIFEKREPIERDSRHDTLSQFSNHVVLIGAHRMGESILFALKKHGEKVAVVDFNPDIVEKLRKRGTLSVFGDIADLDIQDRVAMQNARLVISTVPDIADNIALIKNIKHSKHKTKIVVLGQNKEESEKLYKAGADYVVMPHVVGGMHIAKMIQENKFG